MRAAPGFTGIFGEVLDTPGPLAVSVHPVALAVTKVQEEETVPEVFKAMDNGSARYSAGRLSFGSVPESVRPEGWGAVTLK